MQTRPQRMLGWHTLTTCVPVKLVSVSAIRVNT
ncbi:unnamed protein product [Tetraodon nigroviridis]|uniref:(spotted green pufferfish) hypothetical protein n=1 Tax=Tetraodon nigroviridis TaxID=99883 RepID=Q4RHX2_TETNG|nr:unnamed protein product [Tetraodon nigroviridis]